MKNKIHIDIAKSRKAILSLAVASLAFLCRAAGEASVRTYSSSAVDTVAPGETKTRSVEVSDSPPYVATAPLSFSFAPKFELPCEDWDVTLLRINFLVGSHRAVYALDIGGLGNFADWKMDGIGVAGLFNSTGSSDGALHIAGIFNYAAYDFDGLQTAGIYSGTEGVHCGAQIAAVNCAGKMCGVQIGAVNIAERLEGVQIGLVNVNKSGPLKFFPVMNVGF